MWNRLRINPLITLSNEFANWALKYKTQDEFLLKKTKVHFSGTVAV